MINKVYTSDNFRRTLQIGGKFVGHLRDGEVVGLKGDLGAGKTVFVQRVSKSLGIQSPIKSTTFILRREYEVTHKQIKKLIHNLNSWFNNLWKYTSY